MSDFTPPATVTVAERLAAFAPAYARQVLEYFDRRPVRAATIDELARFVRAEAEPNADETAVRIQLHHSTLPKLADADLIEYDPGRKTAYRRAAAALSRR
ncbi:DUF7344 domain-containing protein [Halovivax limisalsi]|uniref:DUF7344 domain-containing protein n=1 Tax=Halovivax limisalsi TaxID=1453760 RepID=UPI001FFD43B4|nr:hypothetical protein [Halovivax limisalsi]